jgi:prepilin-type N-terminal cleavage/methylation domain-containing protein
MNKKKAFTLLEILIASSIFAITLIIAMSTISWASTYNNRLAEMRKVSLTGRKLIEMISDDIRRANGSVTVKGLGDTFVSGELAILCNSGVTDRFGELQHTYNLESYTLCTFKTNTIDTNIQKNSMYPVHNNSTGTVATSNVLMVVNKSDGKVILYRGLEDKNEESDHYGDIIRSEIPYAETIDLSENDIDTSIKDKDVINENGIDMFAYFGGFTPKYDDPDKKIHPFIKIDILSKTENYDLLPAQYKSKIDLTTTVETRSYK